MNVAAGDAELADAERLPAASRHHHEDIALQLARRLPRGRRCQGSREPQADRPQGGRRLGGGTHNALPLPKRDLLIVVDETVLDDQEDGFKPIWVFDNQVKSNPISIATFPEPTDKDYLKVGGHFGPHNIHENRPGSFQSEELIFATYQNAGIRVYDIRNQLRPQEVAGFVPPTPPARWVDPRPNRPRVLHSADVYVDKKWPLLRDRLQRRPLYRPIRREAPAGARLSATRCRKTGEGIEMATTDVPAPSHAHNMRLIGHTDQNGRGDGQQIMVQMATPISAMSARAASASSTCATRRGRRR